MALSPATGAVLAAVQFHADDSIQEVSRRAKLAPHVVQYQLQKLRGGGIVRSGSVINHFRLGLRQWQAYAALDSSHFEKRAAIVSFLRKAPEVYWVGELGGEYQLGMSVTAPSAAAFADFFARLAARFGSPFSEKSIAEVLSYTMFPKKYLAPQLRLSECITVAPSAEDRARVDRSDLAILGLLSDSTLGSHPQIARKLGLPRSTFEYRLKALERQRLVLRHVYYINGRRLGYLTFRVLVTMRGMPRDAGTQMLEFCSRDPNTVFLVQSLGAADFEIVVEVPEGGQVTAVLERLHAACRGMIDRVRVVPVFEQSTSSAFLQIAAN